jgi:hypothetical protein
MRLVHLLTRGRGREPSMKRLVALICCLEIVTGSRTHQRWIPSEKNCVDGGSRRWEHLRRADPHYARPPTGFALCLSFPCRHNEAADSDQEIHCQLPLRHSDHSRLDPCSPYSGRTQADPGLGDGLLATPGRKGGRDFLRCKRGITAHVRGLPHETQLHDKLILDTCVAVACGGTSGNLIGDGGMHERCPLSSDDVLLLLPSSGSSIAKECRPCKARKGRKHPQHKPLPRRDGTGVKDGSRRHHDPVGLARFPVARKSFGRAPGRGTRGRSLSADLPRVQQALSRRSEEVQIVRDKPCAIPTPPWWSITRPSSPQPVPWRSQGPRTMADGPIPTEVRGARESGTGVPESRRGDTRRGLGSPCRGETAPLRIFYPPRKKVLQARTFRQAVELFSGCAGFSKTLSEIGITCQAWDIIDSPHGDILLTRNRKTLEAMLRSGSVLLLFAGLPCRSWSIARKHDGVGPPPLRDDHRFLWGLPNLNETDQVKGLLGDQLWLVTFRLICLAASLGLPCIIENPKSSRVWMPKQMGDLMRRSCARFAEAHCCQYQKPWKKLTFFVCINMPQLPESLKMRTGSAGFCSASLQPHLPLQGRDASGNWWTRRAQAYPHALCQSLAQQSVEAIRALHLKALT